MGLRVLIVEDDALLAEGIEDYFVSKGWEAEKAEDGEQALEFFKARIYQLILLDVMIPKKNGFTVCRKIREVSDVPIFFITARVMEEDELNGYAAGGDDYVTKPFSMKILLKKIDVILKRSSETRGEGFDDGFLRIDFTRAKAEKNGQPCPVTPTEFRILREFISHKGQLLTYDVLLERLWDGGSQFVDRHALAVNMNRLRGKIEDKEHRYISNVYGMGYQWIGQ